MTAGKIIALIRRNFVGKEMSLLLYTGKVCTLVNLFMEYEVNPLEITHSL